VLFSNTVNSSYMSHSCAHGRLYVLSIKCPLKQTLTHFEVGSHNSSKKILSNQKSKEPLIIKTFQKRDCSPIIE